MPMAEPRALFVFPDEPPQPDTEVCSGRYRDWLEGAACPYAEDGRMPLAEGGRMGWEADGAAPQSGELPDAANQVGTDFPCTVARLGRLEAWRGEVGLQFPPELGRMTLFKCKQMFLLVVFEGAPGGGQPSASS